MESKFLRCVDSSHMDVCVCRRATVLQMCWRLNKHERRRLPRGRSLRPLRICSLSPCRWMHFPSGLSGWSAWHLQGRRRRGKRCQFAISRDARRAARSCTGVWRGHAVVSPACLPSSRGDLRSGGVRSGSTPSSVGSVGATAWACLQ